MAEENLKENKEIYNTLKDKLNIDSDIVAIKIIKNKNEIPEGIKEIEKPLRHCQLTKLASKGKSFYAPLEKQACKGGASALGLTELPEKLKSGEFYVKLGRFKDTESAKETLKHLPSLKKENYAIVYAPLNKANFEINSIIIYLKPVQAMKIAQALIYEDYPRINSDFAGIQSLCGDAVAKPINTKGINITLGCDGSRKYGELEEENLVVGIDKSKIKILEESLKKITGE